MMPLAGAALGVASGALRGQLIDLGMNDDFMKQAARTLQSGDAALFLLIREMTTDKVLAALQGAGGTVLRSSFDETNEETLQAALAGCPSGICRSRGVRLPAGTGVSRADPNARRNRTPDWSRGALRASWRSCEPCRPGATQPRHQKGGLTCCFLAVSLSPTFWSTFFRSLYSYCGSGCSSRCSATYSAGGMCPAWARRFG
jgi:hypothetical protein